MGALNDILPPPPIYPKIELSSKATPDAVEKRPALPDTPEYQEYRRKQREWERHQNRVYMDFSLDYGIVAWQFPGDDEWHSTPPKDWEVDPIVASWGLHEVNSNDRVAYIKQEIITTDADAFKIDRVTEQQAPISQEEVDAAMVPFDSNDSDDQSSDQKVDGEQ